MITILGVDYFSDVKCVVMRLILAYILVHCLNYLTLDDISPLADLVLLILGRNNLPYNNSQAAITSYVAVRDQSVVGTWRPSALPPPRTRQHARFKM